MSKISLDIILNDPSHIKDEMEYTFVKGIRPVERYIQFVDRSERNNAQVISRLQTLKVVNDVTEVAFRRAVNKVTDFIYAMESSFNVVDDKIDYETIIEDSIVVKFRSHPKMRLNIYYEEEQSSTSEENDEESYLLYERQGRMTLVNDTIENNVERIRKILSV